VKFEGEIQMIAFYLSLAALAAAGAALIRQMAAIEAKKQRALQPVRVRDSEHRSRRG
jgi:hypothetical protein